ncbi:MAG: nickel-dependent hydrogenase large subunit [Eubacteriales bacterium]|nr:nickel-dependent hydrogenase large subunit [Eubacteriales bacterium]
MSKQSIVPFGPQHPVLPEPIHIDLVLEDEKVVEAIPSVGFVHRGLEELAEKRDFNDYLYVVERTCGICSFGHGLGYVEALEAVMSQEVPDRAKYLRTFWFEMSRIHSHLLWLGLLADAFGFDALFMQAWRMREKVLDMFEESTGGRVIFSVNTIGGVRKDMDSAMIKSFVDIFDGMEKELKRMTDVFLNDYTVQTRLKGVGILTKEDAHRLSAAGAMARASGIEIDMRKTGYEAYGNIEFDIITSNDCDGYARCAVRIGELFQSINIIRQVAQLIPDGPIAAPKVKGMPNGEAFVRIEQPRGEALYYAKANGTKFLERFRIRTPTFTNIQSLIHILPGSDMADVPMQILTIDPCISCTER